MSHLQKSRIPVFAPAAALTVAILGVLLSTAHARIVP